MENKSIKMKISGFGGQGIILSSYIVGKATTIFEDKNASMTQSYGPEARGGACSSQLVISNKDIDYPLVDEADILITLSQEAYTKYIPMLKENGILLYDNDLVTKFKSHKNIKVKKIPATRLAEELGKKIVANIVMLGFATAQTKFATYEAMSKAVASSVPEKYKDLNAKAFDIGFNYKEE